MYFFIDPMSYNNLEDYDVNVLSKFSKDEVLFFGNIKLKSTIEFEKKLIFNYSDKKGVKKVLSYLKSQFILLYFIFKKKPVLLHFQWFKLPFFDFVLLLLINSIYPKTKIIFTAHNILPHDTGLKFFKIFKKIYNLVDKIIVHDNNTKKEILDQFLLKEDKVQVVFHGLLNLEKNEEKIEEISNSIKYDGKIVFAFMGHINKYKGIELLFEAWNNSDTLKNNNNIQLLIIGKGGKVYSDKFKKFKNVKIINSYLSNNEFVSYIRISDIILMPYIKISQSGILLTVLNERKFVIVSNVGGLADPFKLGNVGWMLPELSSKLLEEYIIKVSNKFKKGSLIDNNVFRKIQNVYNWDAISQQTKNLYITIINEK
ncbi:glycosyltransferase [uncultured Polaribacter sp.]|uniref:glycosyltransferase n=1 Tax=uncultured Polaribacter sp. TaxID=174711 RepID=UPI0026379160|nr:glycosyltransferase [uncultured Polaribacter sp.]